MGRPKKSDQCHKQLPWMAILKVGDVLETPTGKLRVVRNISRFECGCLRAATFVILRCSWTHRPYTVVNYTDMRIQNYRYTGKTVELRSKLDKELRKEIDDMLRQKLKCCDVKGVG